MSDTHDTRDTAELQGPALAYVGFYFYHLTDETMRLRDAGVSGDGILWQERQIIESARARARSSMREMGYTRQVVRQAERDAEKHASAVLKNKGARP